jgi:hypothetical protein
VSKADNADSPAVPKRVDAEAQAPAIGKSARKYGQSFIRQRSCRTASAMRHRALQDPGKLGSDAAPLANSAFTVVTARG